MLAKKQSNTRIVCLKMRLYKLPHLLLLDLVGGGRRREVLVLVLEWRAKPNAIARNGTLGRDKKLDVRMGTIRSSHQHSGGLDTAHVPRLKIRQNHHSSVLKEVERNVIDEAAADETRVGLSDIDLFDVEGIGLLMAPCL